MWNGTKKWEQGSHSVEVRKKSQLLALSSFPFSGTSWCRIVRGREAGLLQQFTEARTC